jgi:hypothetical protein
VTVVPREVSDAASCPGRRLSLLGGIRCLRFQSAELGPLEREPLHVGAAASLSPTCQFGLLDAGELVEDFPPELVQEALLAAGGVR